MNLSEITPNRQRILAQRGDSENLNVSAQSDLQSGIQEYVTSYLSVCQCVSDCLTGRRNVFRGGGNVDIDGGHLNSVNNDQFNFHISTTFDAPHGSIASSPSGHLNSVNICPSLFICESC